MTDEICVKIETFTAYRPLVATHGKHNNDQMNSPDAAQFQGVVFSDGTCIIRWLTAKRSSSIWASISDMLDIHGHSEYGTYLIWGDGRAENYIGNGKFEPRQEKLKPCPFCYGSATYFAQSGKSYISCENEDCPISKRFFTKEEWNRRAK